jgi:hypothetical protein
MEHGGGSTFPNDLRRINYMATHLTLMRLAVSCMLAAAMLAGCGGSQMSGSSVGTTPGAPNSQQSTILPADGGGDCGGDAHGRFGPNDGGNGCCRGDGGSWQGANGIRSNDEGGGHCRSISVKPHRVFFTVSNPGPVTVTVTTQKQGTVSETDTCGGASGIATVTQGTGDQWTVTAGAQQGSCKALFILQNTSGQKIGQAVLHITNFL